jgi:hypothetical protein
MQTWEYLTVQLGTYGIKNDKLAVQYLNGQELRDWKNVPLNQFLNQLGGNGWEMTGTLSSSSGTINYLIFKRPSP